MLDRQAMVRGASIGEVESTQRPGQEIKLNAAFQAGGATPGGVATANPRGGQRIGQSDGGAVVDPHAAKPLEDRDTHWSGGDDILDTGGEDVVEQSRGALGETLIDRLGGHIHPDAPGHLGQLLDGGSGLC